MMWMGECSGNEVPSTVFFTDMRLLISNTVGYVEASARLLYPAYNRTLTTEFNVSRDDQLLPCT
jgi:hypothetical protein